MKKNKEKTLVKSLKEDLGDLERYIKEFSAFLPLAVCTVNPLGIIININQAFQNLAGYGATEIVGELAINLFSNKKEAETLEKTVFKEKTAVTKELILLTKEKKEIPVSVSASAREDETGNIIGYFLAISDISEFKKLQEGLEEKVKGRTQELQEKIEELERFQRLAVGRELKMVALKEEIEKLKEELEKAKGRT